MVNNENKLANPPKLIKADNITKNEIIDETSTLLYLKTSFTIEKTETTLLFISPLQLNIVSTQINNIVGNTNGNATKPNQNPIENKNTKKQPIYNLTGFNVVSHLGLSESSVFVFTEKNQDI